MPSRNVVINTCPTCAAYRPLYEDGRCNQCMTLDNHTPVANLTTYVEPSHTVRPHTRLVREGPARSLKERLANVE
jgi:hypothetical protein